MSVPWLIIIPPALWFFITVSVIIISFGQTVKNPQVNTLPEESPKSFHDLMAMLVSGQATTHGTFSVR